MGLDDSPPILPQSPGSRNFSAVVPDRVDRSRRGYSGGMGENTDKLKGHIKEAAGDITDDKDLEREGKIDQASGTVKGKIDDVKDKLT